MLHEHEIQEIEEEAAKVPQRRAACIDALRIVQRGRGWISDETLAEVAALLGMSVADLDGVATFYNLIFRRPVGRHVILQCDSVSCWIRGSERLQAALESELGVGLGATTPDRRFTLLPVACLGVCEQAPALMIGEDLHAVLTAEDVPDLLRRYR